MKSTRRAAAVLLATGALVAMSAAVTAIADPSPPIPTPPAAPETSGAPAPVPPGGAAASGLPTPGRGGPGEAAKPALDLTRPGIARQVIDDILDAAGATRAIMVSVTATEATVAVLNDDGVAETWGYRDGVIAPVQSDVDYVSQASFVPAQFDLSDVGALFRAGLAVSGSDEGQMLTIVDYSASLVAMTVTTVPESRTVFFQPDGTLLPTLDFTTADGLAAAHAVVVGPRYSALAVGFGSDGVYLNSGDGTEGTVMRRQRSARTPVIVTTRTEPTTLRPFDPARISPAVVSAVVERAHDAGEFTYDQPWSCEADDREQTGTPRLHCRLGSATFVTDLSGTVIPG